MKNYLFVFAGVCLAMYGCGSRDSRQSGANTDFEITYPYSVSIDIAKAVPMDNVLDSEQIVTFTEDVENIMAAPHNAVVRGDTIYAIDARKAPGIYAYLTNGEQLFAYCSVGNGPGDIISPACLSVTDDEISTYDTASSKIVVIGKDGQYRRSVDVPVMTMNAFIDSKGNAWADFTNQEFDTVRVSCLQRADTVFHPVLNVPELQKGMTMIAIEALQELPDGTVGYTPAFEPRIYTLSDGCATVRYELDFNGLWPDDETFKENFTGDAWAPKARRFPVQHLRFHESVRYFVLRFSHKKDTFFYILDKLTGKDKTISVDAEKYFGSIYLTDTEIYLFRKDDRLEIMKIKEIE